jgi:uncharacterized protein YggE
MRYRGLLAVLAAVAAVALAVGMYTAGSASAPRQEGAQVRTERVGGVSVSGEGAVTARPDTAYLNLGFTAENASVDAARTQAAENMTAVLNRIKALGVAEKDIQTSGYHIHRDTERKVFVVSNQVSVTIRDVDASGKLLDGAVAAGANSVHGISFGIEDRAALESRARAEALRVARAKAEELARLGGVQIGAPVAISEGVSDPPIIYQERAMAASADSAGAPTPIEAGEMEVRISVQVTYGIL